MNDFRDLAVLRTIEERGAKALHAIPFLLPEHFERHEHAELFRVIVDLDRAGREITSSAITAKIDPQLRGALVEIVETLPLPNSKALVESARDILDGWKMRQARTIAASFGFDEYTSVNDYITMYAEMLQAVADCGDSEGVKKWAAVLQEAKKEMFSPVSPNRLKLGFANLDRMLNGVDPTDFLLLAARPAVGKSAFKEQIVRNMARGGKKILNVSLEMPDIQLAERQTAALSGISLSDLRSRVAAQEGSDIEREKIEIAMEEMQPWKIDVYDSPKLNPSTLQRLVKRGRYDVVVVDYGGLMQSDAKTENRVQEMSAVSRALRGIALGCKVQMITLLQIGREAEMRTTNRLLMRDLKETGQWEQDATHIIGMSPLEDDKVLLEILKNRHGECGTQVMRFDKPRMDFRELEERYEEPKRKLRGMS